jgi:hypothetical protein
VELFDIKGNKVAHTYNGNSIYVTSVDKLFNLNELSRCPVKVGIGKVGVYGFQGVVDYKKFCILGNDILLRINSEMLSSDLYYIQAYYQHSITLTRDFK